MADGDGGGSRGGGASRLPLFNGSNAFAFTQTLELYAQTARFKALENVEMVSSLVNAMSTDVAADFWSTGGSTSEWLAAVSKCAGEKNDRTAAATAAVEYLLTWLRRRYALENLELARVPQELAGADSPLKRRAGEAINDHMVRVRRVGRQAAAHGIGEAVVVAFAVWHLSTGDAAAASYYGLTRGEELKTYNDLERVQQAYASVVMVRGAAGLSADDALEVGELARRYSKGAGWNKSGSKKDKASGAGGKGSGGAEKADEEKKKVRLARCYVCGSVEHLARKCPKAFAQEEVRLEEEGGSPLSVGELMVPADTRPYLWGEFVDKASGTEGQRLMTLLDTGAQASCVRMGLGENLRPAARGIVDAKGRELANNGVVDVTMKVGELVRTFQAYAVEWLPVGRDVLMAGRHGGQYDLVVMLKSRQVMQNGLDVTARPTEFCVGELGEAAVSGVPRHHVVLADEEITPTAAPGGYGLSHDAATMIVQEALAGREVDSWLVDALIENQKAKRPVLDVPPMKIHFRENAAPTRTPAYNQGVAIEREKERQLRVAEQLGRGVVLSLSEARRRPWAHAILAVPKKNGEVRLATDMARGGNSAILPQPARLTPLEHWVAGLDKNFTYFFFGADVRRFFECLPVHESAYEFLTLVTATVGFESHVVPTGGCSTPAHAQLVMESLVAPAKPVSAERPGAHAWIDDVTAAVGIPKSEYESASEPEKRVMREKATESAFRPIIEALSAVGAEIALDKLQLPGPSVNTLGHVLSNDGLAPDPKKIEALSKLASPTSRDELVSAMGALGYQKGHVPEYAGSVGSLAELLPARARFVWETRHEEAFQSVKKKVASAIALSLVKGDDEMYLTTDANPRAWSGLIWQKPGEPVLVASGRWTPTQSHWPIGDLEFAAGAEVMQRGDYLLLGRQFTWIVDHRNIVHFFTRPLDHNTRRTRIYVNSMQRFDFSVHFERGGRDGEKMRQDMAQADALSRAVRIEILEDGGGAVSGVADPEQWEWQLRRHGLGGEEERLGGGDFVEALSERAVASVLRSLGPLPSWDLDHVRGVQGTVDFSAPAFDAIRPYFRKRGGVLFVSKNGRARVVVPSISDEDIRLWHEHLGHAGVTALVSTIGASSYIPRLRERVAGVLKDCVACRLWESKNSKAAPRYRMRSLLVAIPWFEIACDAMGPWPPDQMGARYILVTLCLATRYVVVRALRRLTAQAVAECLAALFLQYGAPHVFRSDNGSEFVGGEMRQLLEDAGIEVHHGTPHHPQSQGDVERVNGSLGKGIAMERRRDKGVSLAAAAGRAAASVNLVKNKEGSCAFERFYGRPARTSFALKVTQNSEYIKWLEENDRQRLLYTQNKNLDATARMDEQMAKARSEGVLFEVGDEVFVKDENSVPTKGDPFRVFRHGTVVKVYNAGENYLVAVNEGATKLHVVRERLRPAVKREDAFSNMVKSAMARLKEQRELHKKGERADEEKKSVKWDKPEELDDDDVDFFAFGKDLNLEERRGEMEKMREEEKLMEREEQPVAPQQLKPKEVVVKRVMPKRGGGDRGGRPEGERAKPLGYRAYEQGRQVEGQDAPGLAQEAPADGQ